MKSSALGRASIRTKANNKADEILLVIAIGVVQRREELDSLGGSFQVN